MANQDSPQAVPDGLSDAGGQWFRVDGARIHVHCHGPQAAPAVLLLHGGLGHSGDLESVAQPLAARHRVVRIDSRGHGRSTLGPGGWTYERVQRDVEAIVRTLGLGPFGIVGFSDGGIVAYRLAALSGLPVQRVATLGATWHHQNLEGSRQLLAAITAESWRAKFPESHADYQRLNPEPDFARLVSAVVPGWLDTGASGHPDDAVDRIACPVLIARGDDDHLTSLADAVALRQRLQQAHFLSIPFAGHVAFGALFQHALEEFLAS